MVWIIVIAHGEQKQIKGVEKKELFFIGLSGLATGASWICYYYAIQNGIVSVVAPIDEIHTAVFEYFSAK